MMFPPLLCHANCGDFSGKENAGAVYTRVIDPLALKMFGFSYYIPVGIALNAPHIFGLGKCPERGGADA